MTKATLVQVSIVGDVLGFIPVVGWVLSIPLLILHFNYAGARALICLLEALPMVGMLPVFTGAALTYPDTDVPDQIEG